MSKIFSTTDPALIRRIAENERRRGEAVKYGPLTDEERKDLAQSIEEVLEYFDPNISNLDSMDEPNLYAARVANRYEKTLQEKDATIAALVREWEGLLTQLLPSGEKAIVCLPSGALWSFDAAIKEATP